MPPDVPLGVMTLADVSKPPGSSGSYTVARVEEWESETDQVTVWRGPEKPDEVLPRMRLRDITCGALLVDDRGFFFCRIPREEVHEAAERLSLPLLEYEADYRLAEDYSLPDLYQEDFPIDQIWVTATFGDFTAVNGEILAEAEPARHPRGWVKTDRGGYVPSEYTYIDKEGMLPALHREVEKALGRPVEIGLLTQVVDEIYPNQEIEWSGSGKIEVWVSRRAMAAFDHRSGVRSRAEQEAYVRARQAEREQWLAERREAIRHGRTGRKQDWSPRGVIPGEGS